MATTAAAKPANYNTGFFSSPSDLKVAADLANEQVTAIDGVVSSATSAPSSWASEWASFKTLWTNFYQADFMQGEAKIVELWLTSDLEGQLATFESKIATFGAQAQQYGASVPGGVTQPEDNSLPDWFPSSGTVIAVSAIVLATVVAWKVL
jgi:hypothetical protein